MNLHSLTGRAMRPRSADSFRKDLPPRRQGRKGTQRWKGRSYGLFVIGYWGRKRRSHFFKGVRRRPAGSVTHLAGHLFLVAGASCSRPSMERPAPCSDQPMKKQIQGRFIRRTFRECICRASGNFSKPRSGLGMAGAKQRHMGPCLKKPHLHSLHLKLKT